MNQQEIDLLKQYYPFPSKFLTIAGHQMHYIDVGSGPVVILLHGNPTWGFYYRELVKTLQENYRVIVPDFLGMGLSDHPIDASFRSSDRIQHMQEFIDSLEIKKFSLVTHDWGGSIGSGLAIRNLEKLERLVYLNTTLTVTESLPLIIKRATKPLIGNFLTQRTKHFLKLTTEVGVAKKLPKEIKKCYLLPYKTRARRKAIWDFVADIPFDSNHPSYPAMLDLAENIGTLSKIPVQIIWGLKDPCFHREMLNNVAGLFPQSRVLEIPDASHLVLEDAEELTCKTIKNFLAMPYEEAIQPIYSDDASTETPEDINAFFRAFTANVKKQPYTYAAIEPSFLIDDLKYRQINFKDLAKTINKYQRGLSELGLKAGDKVLMLVPPGINFLTLSYAVMGRGAVPVFLDPGMGKEKLINCIEELKPDVLIASLKAELFRFLKPKIFSSVRFRIVASEWFLGRAYSLSYLKKFAEQSIPAIANPDQNVLVAYTSGATGRPKGVVYDNQMINAQLKIFKEQFGLEAGKKDLPLLPIFSLFNLALGITSVIAPLNPSKPLELDPRKVTQIINDLGINYSFGSPTLWRKIAEYCFRSRQSLLSLEKIFMAGAPVPESTVGLLKDVVPNGESFTPYGATEALPVTLISGQEILDLKRQPAKSGEQGTLVGKEVKGVEIKIIARRSDQTTDFSAIQELEHLAIGEIIVAGDNISKKYFELPEANKKSKILEGSKLWHVIGDLGYLDLSGNLYFCGRTTHLVEYQGAIYYSEPCEIPFNLHPKVSRTALVKLDSGEPAIVIEPLPQYYPDTSEKKAIFVKELKLIAGQQSFTKHINRFFFHQSFPVDPRHNAKIYRDILGVWASQQEPNLSEI